MARCRRTPVRSSEAPLAVPGPVAGAASATQLTRHARRVGAAARRGRGRSHGGRLSHGHRADRDKLREITAQAEVLQAELARPEVSADPEAIRRLGRELARLQPVVEAFGRLEETRAELAGARGSFATTKRTRRCVPSPGDEIAGWRRTRSTLVEA